MSNSINVKCRPPLYFTGPAGKPLVRVPLAGRKGTFATLDRADFHRLLATGLSPRWNLNRDGKLGIGYVRSWWATDPRGRSRVSIAPLIMGTQPGQRVRYLDGDRLNLRRENLRVEGNTGRP